MRIVVAIYEPAFWTIPEREVRYLAARLPDDVIVHVTSREAEAAAVPDADVLFATRLRRDDFQRASHLRWVHSSAVGVGGILSPDFVASAVPLSNARGLHAEPIAEHAMALMLALRRSLHVAVARQIARAWAQEEIYARHVAPLDASTLLVVGLGAIGSRVADWGRRLGITVLAVRKHHDAPAPAGIADVFPPDRLHDGLARADVVVLAAPHTSETTHMIDCAALASMKTGSLLINVARGKLVDHAALAASLGSGHLGGAGLDAFDHEPLAADDPLWGLPNVLITPHTAAFGADYWRPAVDLFIENMRRLRAGAPLINLVDKTRGY